MESKNSGVGDQGEACVPGSVKADSSRIDSEARAMKALPDTGFAAVTGVFVGPDRAQQFADFLLKLQKGSPFGVVADEIF